MKICDLEPSVPTKCNDSCGRVVGGGGGGS